ncbi:hypothetical protein GSI_09858 [Ganoderma sinense ZZ0214-1]|uniref:Uncharacterized protein n=1 Tax=Ganoderma sinense ZZ0214-1 TaxID=1077348 RepID=A0A2G8S2P2_9APHY|nr:hypothetical protein GSI_09858 [Ganoderma sinense ZZ0214-1]
MAFDPVHGSTRLAIAPCRSPVGLSVVDVETGCVLAQMEGQLGKNMVMHDFLFSPDGTLVLGVCSIYDGGVCLWEAATGIRLFMFPQYVDDFRKAWFSPCGRDGSGGCTGLEIRLYTYSETMPSRSSNNGKAKIRRRNRRVSEEGTRAATVADTAVQ